MSKNLNKKKYSDKKLHFIIFQTTKKPINISISKWIIYSLILFLVCAISAVSIMLYITYTTNVYLAKNLSSAEDELKLLKVDKIKADIENSDLKDTLSIKSSESIKTMQELEELKSSIKQIKMLVGIKDENQNEENTIVVKNPSGSRYKTIAPIRSYNNTDNIEALLDENQDENIRDFLDETKQEIESLQVVVEDKIQYLKDVPSALPTNGKYTSYFGARWGGFHRGIDISNSYGTKIYAAGNGTVIESKYNYSYGHYILIQHKNGFVTRYAHLSKRYASSGDEISQGDLIGLMGSTGTSYGVHLHYEVYYKGSLIDPLKVEEYFE